MDDEAACIYIAGKIFEYLLHFGSPKDAARRPMKVVEIGRALGREPSDISKLMNPEAHQRKSVGAGIFRRISREFGISPAIQDWDLAKGDPNIADFIVLAEHRGGSRAEAAKAMQAIDELRQTVTGLVETVRDHQQRLDELVMGRSRRDTTTRQR